MFVSLERNLESLCEIFPSHLSFNEVNYFFSLTFENPTNFPPLFLVCELKIENQYTSEPKEIGLMRINLNGIRAVFNRVSQYYFEASLLSHGNSLNPVSLNFF